MQPPPEVRLSADDGSGSKSQGTTAQSPRGSPGGAPPPNSKSRNWRDEKNDEDDRDFSDDEETTKKKLEESRKRREAMMAKWVQEKKDPEGGADTPPARPGKTGGETTGAEDGTASEEEEPPPAEEELDEAARQKAAEVREFVLQAKKEEERAREKAQEEAEANADANDDGGDMFDTSADADAVLKSSVRQSANIGFTGASGEDWNDEEGYYLAKIGEVMDGRFLIVENAFGRGVFSNVVKAKDQQSEGKPLVAIKIMRANDMMTKAAEKEIAILQKLNRADKGSKRHIIRLLDTFAYRKHICLVFECMWDDLRAALKKYTKNKGMSLEAIRAYTKQLLVGLRHMHKCKVIHADLKPDNILISEGHNVVKICDLGTAIELQDIAVSPYLASRFYRPPEVILGCDYGVAVDIWALGCTLFELFTGKVLLPGKTNNHQLKLIMDLKGKVPSKVLKKGAVWKQHFDDNTDFKFEDTDKYTKETVVKTLTDLSAKRDLKELVLERVGPEKRQSQLREDQQYVKRAQMFADVLDKMLALDPEKRITAEDALHHQFLSEWKTAHSAA